MSSSGSKSKHYPAIAPRFWHGMLLSDWIRLVGQNHCRIHPLRLGLAFTVTGATVVNSTLRLANQAIYGRKLPSTELVDDPVFIVGHWRSGTTYLHELMSCDDRFASPSTYQCFAANHFLLSEGVIPKLLWFVMPSKRPMDNVRVGWDAPQEDEFALCSMGLPSPYLRMAFPNVPNRYLDYLDLEGVSNTELDRWKKAFLTFLKGLTLDMDKRLILKSPTHTARIGLLAQMFPRAKFLHIVRDPLAVYPSTLRLWRVLDEAQSLQIPHHRNLDAYVLEAFQKMYRAFEQGRDQLSPNQIYDIRYEELVADPARELRQAYEALDLGDFDAVAPRLTEFVGAKREYRTNRYELSPEVQNEVLSHWGDYASKYGYTAKAH